MNNYDPKEKSLHVISVKYDKKDLEKLSADMEKIEKYRKASSEKILEKIAKYLKEDFKADMKEEASKALITAAAVTTAASTLIGSAAYANGLSPINIKAGKSIEEDAESINVQLDYNSYCIDMILQIQNKYNFRAVDDPERLYKELAIIANNANKLDHDSIIAAFAYLCKKGTENLEIYNKQAYNKFVENMNGYNYGETDEEKIRKINDKTAGIDFTTEKNIDQIIEEGEKLYIRMGGKKFNIDKVLNEISDINNGVKQNENLNEIIRTDGDRQLYADINKLALEIVKDDGTIDIDGDIKLYELYSKDRDMRIINNTPLEEKTDFDKLIEVVGYLIQKKDPEHITTNDVKNNNILTIKDYVNSQGLTMEQWFSKINKELEFRQTKENLEDEFSSRGVR